MSYTAYSSTSYLVLANEAGTEITNLHSGDTKWFQGDESNELRRDLEEIASIGGDDAYRVERFSDVLLSQYFGG
jgi:hypothetical protein